MRRCFQRRHGRAFADVLIVLLLTINAAWALDAMLGKALFERLWVAAPASTDAADGLGPLYNARACASCHPRAGRGRLAVAADGTLDAPGLVIGLGNDPRYGAQLQTRAIAGHAAEGKIKINYTPRRTVALAGGKQVALREPHYTLTNLAYGPLAPTTGAAPRLAPALHGLGWFERIPVAAIINLSDPDDRNNDGISGRAHWLMTKRGPQLGRYGWKAELSDLNEQIELALLFDMGLSTPSNLRHAGDCTAYQTDCVNTVHGASAPFDNAELSKEMVGLLVR